MNTEFKDTLSMVDSACIRTFYNGNSGIREAILQCATQIYIEKMRLGLTEETKNNEKR